MEEFPRSLAEFEAQFDTEQACRDYLFRLRWPGGFRCPRCGGAPFWPVRSVLMQCRACGHQTSVTAGTIFQDTRKPLVGWFRAMYWLASQKNGASALGLQRVLGLGSYKTAWTWLHKLRRAMVRPGRDRLTGTVEVDETYLGGLEEGVRGRQTERKSLIAIAAQEDGAGIGRIRMMIIPDASASSLMAFLAETVEPGSAIHTDGWLGYEPASSKGYAHRGDGSPGEGGIPVHADAPCPSNRIAAEALDSGNAPRSRQPRASGVLPRRVHFSVQSPPFAEPRQALLPARPAGGDG